jgi:hypothetical protein
MDDFPDFSGIDAKKMALINEFGRLSKGKSNQEILPLLLAISKKAQSMGLSFTKEESGRIIEVLMQDATPEQKQQINMMLNLMKK